MTNDREGTTYKFGYVTDDGHPFDVYSNLDWGYFITHFEKPYTALNGRILEGYQRWSDWDYFSSLLD